MRPFRIVLLRPGRSPHAEALREVAEALHYALQRLGLSAGVAEAMPAAGEGAIVLGAHAADPATLAALPAEAILYNFEQLTDDLFARAPHYRDALGTQPVWDYSAANATRYADFGIAAPRAVVPVGYVPEWTRIAPAAKQDIDVLFYGSINPRRLAILQELREAGLAVAPHFGVYGPARDALIARAKVVLNMHFYDAQILEMPRVGYLLANRVPVVTEIGPATRLEPHLAEAMRGVPRDDLVDACVELVHDEPARRALAERGYAAFSGRRLEETLARALGVDAAAAGPRYPTQANVGSGRDWRPDWLNLDIEARWKPDAILDLSRPLDLPCIIDAGRFGRIALGEGMLDRIMANDVMEHVPDLPAAMANCLRLLKVGGELLVKVPYDLSYGAWQDPTHVRAFNERSFLYYTDWFWYLGWTDFRFDADVRFGYSELGDKLRERGVPADEIARTPRAVDELFVRLRKRPTTDAEREDALRRQGTAR